MKNFLSQSIILICATLLSSCSVFSPVTVETTNQYQLKSVPNIPVARKTGATIIVATPVTNSIFNTTQIAYTNRPYQISYFSKNQWAATPGEMLQELMLQTLQSTHAFQVTQTLTNNRNSYLLTTQIIQLIQDFSYNPSIVRFTIELQLIANSTNRIIASKRFTITEPAFQNTPYSGVEAANRATARFLKEMTEFCLHSI